LLHDFYAYYDFFFFKKFDFSISKYYFVLIIQQTKKTHKNLHVNLLTNTPFIFSKRFCLTLLLLWSFIGYPQDISPSVYHFNYSVSDGLPSAETYDVYQDHQGYIWIGTDKGIAQYDGHQFNVYTTNDGLTDNTILQVHEDHKDRLWMITYNRKLCYLEDGDFIPYKYNDTIVKYLSKYYLGNTITNFTIDSKNNVHLDLTNFISLDIDSNGTAHIFESIYKSEIEPIFENALSIPLALEQSDSIINKNYFNRKFTVKNHRGKFINIYKRTKHTIVSGSDGVRFYDPISFQVKKSILSQYLITGICSDFESGYWFSTLNSGIIYVPNLNITFYSTKNEGMSSNIHYIIPQNEKIIFGFTDMSQYEIDQKSQTLIRVSEKIDISKIPNEIHQNGIKFEYATKVPPLKRTCRAILKLSPNLILFAPHDAGLSFWNIEKSEEEKEKHLDSPKINKILKDYKNNIWTGTKSGLYKLDTIKNVLMLQDDHPLLQNIAVQDLTKTSDSVIIIATRINGLLLKYQNSITSYKTNNGLLSNTINQITFDSAHQILWVATNKGVNGLKWKNKSFTKSYRLSSNSGINSPDIRHIWIQSDTLFLASNSGVSFIKYADLDKNNSSPKIYIKNILINNIPTNQFDNPTLPSHQNNLNFQFQGISYHSFNNIQYKYKLAGLDSMWQTSKNPDLHFLSIPPGKYTLRIKAINIDGIESASIQIPFTILTPFWKTLWFTFLIICLVICATIIIVRRQFTKHKNKAQLQIDLQRFKAMNLQSKMNPHFIFNSLNSIQHFIMANKPEKANDYLLDFSSLIRQVLKNSDSPEISLSNEINTIKLYIDLELKRLNGSFDFKIEIEPDIDQNKCLIPALLIQPYIENAIWHGKLHQTTNGMVVLRINKQENLLYFEIEDNGVGYYKTTLKKASKSYGTGVTKERIELISSLNTKLSEVTILKAQNLECTTPYEGTIIKFNLPYKLTTK